MKRMKRLGSVLLAVGMLCALVIVPSSAAGDPLQRTPETNREPEEMILVPGPVIEPYMSEIAVDNEPISDDGVDWYQKEGYSAYRIWVQNDTKKVMKVTVTYAGMPEGKELEFKVQPGKGNYMIVNNAWEGAQHYVDFQTDDGSFAGTCNVRISDTPFTQ